MKYTWEFIEVFRKESHRKEGPAEKIDIRGDEFKKWVCAGWEIAPESNMKKYHHPAMFPEEVVNRLLKLFSYEEDMVLDPFNGAGTTTLVSAKRHRFFIGVLFQENTVRLPLDVCMIFTLAPFSACLLPFPNC
jgi:DNA modification methylase